MSPHPQSVAPDIPSWQNEATSVADLIVEGFVLPFHTILLIIAFIGLFAVLTLPRLFTRFSRGSEWAVGHILYSVNVGKRRKTTRRRYNIAVPESRTPPTGSDDSHTLHSHTHLIRRAPNEKRRHLSLPPHTQSLSSRYQRLSTFLGRECIPGYSVGRCIIILGYFFIVLYSSIYKSSPFSDPARTGFVSTAHLPIAFALATKNNVIGMFLATGYEKLNWLHRSVGRLVVLAANIHALGYFYAWSIQGDFQRLIMAPEATSGLTALLGADLIVIFSTSFWRKKAYNVFIVTHVIGFIMFPVALVFHKPSSIPWVLATAAIYGFDHIIRLCKTRICDATLRTIPELGMTRIEVPRINAGWRAGQHVRLRVVSSGIGFFGCTEIHPFTIASIGGDGMTLMCKKAGGWTNKLYNMAAQSDSAYSGGERGRSRRAKIILEGPYGGPGHTMFDSFSGAMFVVGGSGITFALASMQDLVQKDIAGRSRVKIIELVWIVQDAASLIPMLPIFTSLIQQAAFTSIRISVHYTRASVVTLEPSKVFGYMPSNITIGAGRPRISNILNTVVDRSCALFTPEGIEDSDELSGVIVGVCGPDALGHDVRTAVGSVDPRRYKAVGGIELCEETFGW